MENRIRVLLANDQPMLQAGIANSLDQGCGFEVVGKAENIEDTIKQTIEIAPNIVLLDMEMAGGGAGAAKIISELCLSVRVVMLTASEDVGDLLAALKCGANGYVLKSVTARELRRILHDVAIGKVYAPPGLASAAVFGASQREATGSNNQLTVREWQILDFVAEGLTNREIGENLFLSEKTVKHHMTKIFGKLRVRNRTEAALLAKRRVRVAGDQIPTVHHELCINQLIRPAF